MANNFELDGQEALPMFQAGGLVKETGLSVEEGESMMPAFDSEAMAEPAQMVTQGVVNYVFPVEVVVVGVLTGDDYREICKCVWNDFGEAWARQSA